VISLEQPEYLVTINNSALSVVITLSNVTSQDIAVEVNITDGTALGKQAT